MKTKKRLAVHLLLCIPIFHVTPALAGNETTAPLRDMITVNAESQEFSKAFGNLRSVRIEYKNVIDSTTVLLTPVVGTRSTATTSETSLGGGLEIYQKWNPKFTTRTALFVSENKNVYAKFEVAQDVTFVFSKQLTGTVGMRLAEYADGEKVVFISAGARRYFKMGSFAYRATYTQSNGGGDYVSHLVNLTINDPTGRGKTQLWLGYGESAMDRVPFNSNFNGHDYGGTVRRVQPLGDGKIDLVLLFGLTTYGNPSGRVWGKTAGLGLSLNLGD